MAKEIKQKITLDGEKEYSAAIKEAQRNLKTLRSALKAETAELGTNASAQQKNEAKVKSLKSQIAEQEKIVKTYKAALAEVREKYADNEDEIAKWEQKLNSARTALASMKNEMDSASGSVDDMSDALKGAGDESAAGVTATKSFADALSDLGTQGSSVAEGLESMFTGFTDKLKAAASAVYEEMVALAGKANAWSDLAGFWGTSTEKVRQFEYAVNASGNTFDEFSSMVTKFALADPAKVLQFSGVNIEEGSDDLENLYQVMTNLSKLSREDQQSAIAGIFGGSAKNYQKIMDILNDWGDIQKGMEKYSPEGDYGMTAEEISQMNELSVKLADIDGAWTALKEKMAVGIFGEVSLKMAGDVQGIIDAFAAFWDADTPEEKAAAMDDFKEKITDFFEHIAEAIHAAADAMSEVGEGLQDSEDSVLKLIGNILTAFSGALEWLSDEKNWGSIQTAFEALVGVWAGAKVATAVANFASFAGNIATLSTFRNWKQLTNILNSAGGAAGAGAGAAGGAGSGAAGSAGGAAASAGAAAGGGLFARLGTVIKTAGTALAGPMGLVASLIAGGYVGTKMIQANMNDESLNEIYGDSEGKNLIDRMDEAMAQRAAEYWALYSDESKTGTEEAMDAREALYQAMEEGGIDLPEQAVSLIENAFDNYLKGSDPDGLVEQILAQQPQVLAFSRERIEEAIQDWWDAKQNVDRGLEPESEEESARSWMETVLGDDFADVFYQISKELENTDENTLDDIPQGWYSDLLDAIVGEDEDNEPAVGLNKLPGSVAAAVTGALNGVKIQIDGQTAGTLLAPYVSDTLGVILTNLIKYG